MEQIEIDPLVIAQMLRRSLQTQTYALGTVTSGSMRPLLQVGDQIGLTAVPINQLQIGDIITFETTSSLITHRLHGLTPTHLITCGDRAIAFDPPVLHRQLIGRVAIRRRQDDILDLRQGDGRRLNSALYVLAQHETAHFSRRYWHWRPVRSLIHRGYGLLGRQLMRRSRLK